MALKSALPGARAIQPCDASAEIIGGIGLGLDNEYSWKVVVQPFHWLRC